MGMDLITALQFENDAILNEQIEAVSAVQAYSFVRNANIFLPLESDPPKAELIAQRHS